MEIIAQNKLAVHNHDRYRYRNYKWKKQTKEYNNEYNYGNNIKYCQPFYTAYMCVHDDTSTRSKLIM